MLTARDIETREFTRSKVGGYKTEEVEAFLDEILTDFTTLSEERDNLAKRVLFLSEKLEKLRDEQDDWKEALVATQKSYEEIVSAAKQKSATIIETAEQQSKEILKNTATNRETFEKEIVVLQEKKNNLVNEVESFKQSILASYEEHILSIKNITSIQKETIDTSKKNKEYSQPAAEKPFKENPPDHADENIEDYFSDKKETVDKTGTDAFQTIVMKPIVVNEARRNQAAEDISDDDDDLLIKPNKKAAQKFVKSQDEEPSKEDRLKDLFDVDTDVKKKKSFTSKPPKKASRFFKAEDDDFFDDDFDDE